MVRRGAFRARTLEVVTPESEHAPHRHLSDLVALLERTPLQARARERAVDVLTRIARAEAEVHGESIEAVHFHEVGAVDTLVDVVGAVVALERLGVERLVSRPPYVGGGTIRGAHGIMPVPAPGTAAILRGLPHELGVGGERLTPTGAALLAGLVDEFLTAGSLAFTAEAIGVGAGSRDPDAGPPNVVRVQWGASSARARGDGTATVTLLECNLDDTSPEEVGFLLGELRRAGALEAWTQPLQMKKDRPGVLVAALSRPEDRHALEAVCFRHSPTLGVRWSERRRTERPRRRFVVDLAARLEALGVAPPPGGPREEGDREWARVLVVERLERSGAGVEPGSASSLDHSPEHDDLAGLARASGLSLRLLTELALREAREGERLEPDPGSRS